MFKVNTKENYTLKTHVEALKTLYMYVAQAKYIELINLIIIFRRIRSKLSSTVIGFQFDDISEFHYLTFRDRF